MLALQRLFYGPLRPIEVEQLYEKAWFAITETCLAMTIFREEVGGWFLIMFVCLLIGKVWGWIGEGRVDILEQQPPANPRLFHARLSFSLIVSTLFDVYMLRYSIQTVLLQARPNMMVMFAFEFAVLTITSLSTAARYTISLREAAVIKNQLSVRRAQLRQEREQAQQQLNREQSSSTAPANDDIVAEDEIEPIDIDVPGWEDKGRWVFYLDLTTGASKKEQPSESNRADQCSPDFFKLVLYLTFFCVLCMFYGMPIHIIRDVALTIRSFYKRINDFVRYRQATRDMNARYPDATAQEVSREDVCIICREDMRPWRQPPHQGGQPGVAAGTNVAPSSPVDERLRPKKLPCGHILHFACLRSWLERQQNCPICRRPVLVPSTVGRPQGVNPLNQEFRAQLNPEQPQGPGAGHGEAQQPLVAQNMFQLGPFRLAFGARHAGQGFAHQGDIQPPQPDQPAPGAAAADNQRLGNALGLFQQAPPNQRTVANFSQTNVPSQIHQIEQQLMREINGLRVQADQLFLVRALQGELARLRMAQTNPGAATSTNVSTTNPSRQQNPMVQGVQPFSHPPVFLSNQEQQSIGSGHRDLPSGVTIPNGWTLLPLQRLPSGTNVGVPPANLAFNVPSSLQSDVSNDTSQPSPSHHTELNVSRRASNFQAANGVDLEDPPRVATTSSQDNASQSSTETASPAPMTKDTERAVVQPTSHGGSSEQSKIASQVQTSKHEGLSADNHPHTLPMWGSDSKRLNGDQKSGQDDHYRTAVSVGNGSRSNGASQAVRPAAENVQAKGKGRAATVEDELDEID